MFFVVVFVIVKLLLAAHVALKNHIDLLLKVIVAH